MEASSSSPSAPSVAPADLERLLDLLSVAADRGAFKIEEYEDVGAAWRKLAAFVQAHKA